MTQKHPQDTSAGHSTHALSFSISLCSILPSLNLKPLLFRDDVRMYRCRQSCQDFCFFSPKPCHISHPDAEDKRTESHTHGCLQTGSNKS